MEIAGHFWPFLTQTKKRFACETAAWSYVRIADWISSQ